MKHCIASILIALFAACMHGSAFADREQRVDRAHIAATAIRQTMDGDLKGARDQMRVARTELWLEGPLVSEKVDLADPFLAWLPAELLAQSSRGELVVRSPEGVRLRLDWWTGDNRNWYVASVVKHAEGKGPQQILQEVLWPFYMQDISPMTEETWVERYALDSVREGDIIELSIFVLAKATFRSAEEIDAASVARGEAGKLVTRVFLPVVVAQ